MMDGQNQVLKNDILVSITILGVFNSFYIQSEVMAFLKMEVVFVSFVLPIMSQTTHNLHKSLRVTPAMEAGITDHVWSLEEIAALI